MYKDTEETEDELKLPKLEQNTQLELKSSNKNQHFTQPPSRFNEASVVKKLEELGIGRPSTYATIINVIQERNYATLQKRAFIPENIGVFVVSFLKNFFKKYVEYTFTANLEEELDNISNGKIGWETVLDNFWTEFNQTILNTDDLTGTKVIDTLESELQDYIFRGVDDNHACHSCDTGKLHLKLSKFGSFLGCSNYPDCRYAQSISDNPQPISFNSNQNYTVICTDYNNDNIFLKKGPFGPYLEWENTKDSNNTKKPKRLPIPKFITSPDTLTTDDIMALIDLPKDLGIHSKLGKNIVLCLGRFGPYLVCDKHNYNLPKEISSLHINLSDAEKIIE